MSQRFPDKVIESAGLRALSGSGADPEMVRLANSAGLSLDDHKARQYTLGMLSNADLIFFMSLKQRDFINDRHPELFGKTMLFGHWLNNSDNLTLGVEIPDPYGKSREVFRMVFEQLTTAADTWKEKLGSMSEK